MADFDLSREIDRYAARICQDIRSGKRRREVKQEYVEHLEDATYRSMMRGMSDADAFQAACDALGDMSGMQTLLGVTHNGDGLPRWFKWLCGGVAVAGVVAAYALVQNEIVKAWLELFLVLTAIAVGVWLVLEAYTWLRAIRKRLDAKKRVKAYAKSNGLAFAEHASSFKSLFKRSATPEWVVETERRRYIISLMPTVRRLRVLHLHENGLYNYTKKGGFVLAAVPGNRLARLSHPMPANLFGRYVGSDIELPRGLYRTPEISYADHHSADRENVHILLLSPIPLDIDLCEGGRIRKISDGDRLPALYGDAQVFSASGFIGFLSHGETMQPRRKEY